MRTTYQAPDELAHTAVKPSNEKKSLLAEFGKVWDQYMQLRDLFDNAPSVGYVNELTLEDIPKLKSTMAKCRDINRAMTAAADKCISLAERIGTAYAVVNTVNANKPKPNMHSGRRSGK